MANDIKLPAGYADAKPIAGPLASNSVSLPAGYQDAKPIAGPLAPAAAATSAPGILGVENAVADVGVGAVKGLGDTVSGFSHLINKIPVVGETLAPQAGIQALDTLDVSKNTAQDVGKGVEAAAEWLIPGLAEEGGAVRAAKLVSLAKKYPLLADTLNLATLHPWLSKMILEGSEGAAKGATIGAVKGAQQGQTIQGAKTGAEIGGATSVAVAAAPMLLNPFKRAASAAGNYLSDIWQGAKAAQEPAEAAVRGGAQAVVPTVQPQSLRTALEHPLSTLEDAASANYKAMDAATGGKFQPNVDALKNVNQELRGVIGTNPARESELEAAKTRLEWQRDQLLNEAESKGVPKETVTLAKTQFRQAQALHDLDTKVFKNTSIIKGNAAMGTPETINVDPAIKALQKMQDDARWGAPRLEQALGKDGAKELLRSLYDAQLQGTQAVSKQQLLARITKITGIGTGTAVGGYEAIKYLFGGD